MIWDIEKPCATCPYRRETKRGLWHRYEFQNLLDHDADPINGAVFGCHSYAKEPVKNHRPCAGWLIDQQRRGVPSIRLRLALATQEGAAALFNRITETGLQLYSSIWEMCVANFGRRGWRKP